MYGRHGGRRFSAKQCTFTVKMRQFVIGFDIPLTCIRYLRQIGDTSISVCLSVHRASFPRLFLPALRLFFHIQVQILTVTRAQAPFVISVRFGSETHMKPLSFRIFGPYQIFPLKGFVIFGYQIQR